MVCSIENKCFQDFSLNHKGHINSNVNMHSLSTMESRCIQLSKYSVNAMEYYGYYNGIRNNCQHNFLGILKFLTVKGQP